MLTQPVLPTETLAMQQVQLSEVCLGATPAVVAMLILDS